MRVIRRLLALVVLLLFIGIFVWWQRDARIGEQRWVEYQAAAQARGAKLTLPEFLAGRLNNRNFATTPMWKRLVNDPRFSSNLWANQPSTSRTSLPGPKPNHLKQVRQALETWGWVPKGFSGSDADAVLAGLAVFQPELSEFHASLALPPTQVQVLDAVAGWDPQAEPSFRAANVLAQALQFKIAAQLHLAQGAEALETWKDMVALSEVMASPRSFASHVFSLEQERELLKQLWLGLNARVWTPAQLSEIEAVLAAQNLLWWHVESIQGSRARINTRLEPAIATRNIYSDLLTSEETASENTVWMRTRRSRWWRENQLWMNQFFDEKIATFRVPEEQWMPPASRSFSLAARGTWDPEKHSLGRTAIVYLDELKTLSLCHHALVRMAGLGCALERHRQQHGTYPEKLEELVPTLLAKLPHDPCTGAPFRYRRSPEEGYLLYGVGMNRTDDGGRSIWMAPASADWRWWAPRPPTSVEAE